LYPFLNWPAGSYVETYSGEPDPDDAAYPATQPSASYDTVVSVTGFFQPASEKVKDSPIRAPWGEEVKVTAIFFCPGDQTVTVNDKIVYGSATYYVVALAPWQDGSTTVQVEVSLTESVPRAS